jgi:murein DD-endopeptidase MepM/ murein hydrolase activator NlpD
MLPAVVLPLALVACVAAADFSQPLDHATNRPTPLHFGLRVTPDPETNPIDPPERFEGYHAAVDYEVSAEELDQPVPVYAICRGRVVYSGYADGYGGLLIHRCTLDGEPISVIYGHLSRNGLIDEGVTVRSGQQIGYLADADSPDSGGTRKHLHLGIHKGKALDMRGYVQTEEELAEYIDPATVLPALDVEGVLPDMKAYWETGTGSAEAE